MVKDSFFSIENIPIGTFINYSGKDYLVTNDYFHKRIIVSQEGYSVPIKNINMKFIKIYKEYEYKGNMFKRKCKEYWMPA